MSSEQIITIILTFLSTLILKNLWDLWREKEKKNLDEKYLLRQLLYQLMSLFYSAEILRNQFREHSNRLNFVTEYATFYVKNLDLIYDQIEGLLRELAKTDPFNAASIRNVQYNEASNNLYILKAHIAYVTKQAEIKQTEEIPKLLETNRFAIDGLLTTMLEITKITMYITSSKIDKDSLDNVATSYPDERLATQFKVEPK